MDLAIGAHTLLLPAVNARQSRCGEVLACAARSSFFSLLRMFIVSRGRFSDDAQPKGQLERIVVATRRLKRETVEEAKAPQSR